MTAAGAAAGFAGSVARQYISDGKVSYKSAAKDGINNGLGTLGLSVGGKALGAAGRYLSETKAVERIKGVVLDGLSSNSESLAAINKKIGSSMQGLMEKIKLPESKLAFETGNSSLGKSTYSSAMEYADKSVMDNFNKVYANREEIQTAVKAVQGSVDELGESAAKGAAEVEVDLAQRAKDIHSTLPEFTQGKTTTGVARVRNTDGSTEILVGSSERRLRPAQRNALLPGEVEAIGDGHAEVTIINQATRNGQVVEDIAASRPICTNCASTIKNIGANPVSPLKKVKGIK